MTDPIDPNAAPRPRPGPSAPADGAPSYQPPPPFAPPSDRPSASPWPLATEPGKRQRRSWAGDGAELEFVPDEQERRSRRIRNGAVALVVAVAVAIGGHFVFSGDSTPSPVSLPARFPGYERLTDTSAQQAESELRASLSRFVNGHQDAVDAAGVGIYQQSSAGTSRVVVLAFPTGAVDVSGPAYEVTDEMFGYLFPVNREYPAGPPGGSVRCGPIHAHGARVIACAWSDGATTGLMYGGNATRPTDLANTVNALRGAIH